MGRIPLPIMSSSWSEVCSETLYTKNSACGGYVTYIASLHSTTSLGVWKNDRSQMDAQQEKLQSLRHRKSKKFPWTITGSSISRSIYWTSSRIALNANVGMSICNKWKTHVHIGAQYWWWSELVMQIVHRIHRKGIKFGKHCKNIEWTLFTNGKTSAKHLNMPLPTFPCGQLHGFLCISPCLFDLS